MVEPVGSATLESVSELKDTQAQASRWKQENQLADKEFERFYEDGKRIVERYKDRGGSLTDFWNGNAGSKFNILWSNTQTLQPALYSRTPKPVVTRRHLDGDPLARKASLVWERAIQYELKSYEFDQTMVNVRDDYLLPGRGQAWLMYVPKLNGDYVEDESVYCQYLNWMDFSHNPARTWDEVRWVRKRVFMTRDEMVSRFGSKIGKAVPLDFTPTSIADRKEELGSAYEYFKKATVFEFWDKTSKQVYWVAQGYDDVLDIKADPLKLKGFFPCPRPLFATLATDSLVPVADYCLYKDQARELDNLTNQISLLVSALRCAGVYDAGCVEVGRLLDEGSQNTLIPVQNWPSFSNAGGLDSVVSFFPLDEVMKTLRELYTSREAVIQDIYQITGISDVIRGSSDPSETAKAQQIKSQFATQRISSRQREVARFSKDLIALKGEIIAEHFSEEKIRAISGYDYMEDTDPEQNPDEWPQIMALLKNDPLRRFRIDIETDSTIALDDQAEKEATNEFISVSSELMNSSLNISQAAPEFFPVMGEMLLFAVRRYRAGRTLEASLETAVQRMQERLSQPPEPPPPDPKLIKAENDFKLGQAELQLDKQKMIIDAKVDEAKIGRMQSKDETQAMLAVQRLQQEMQLKFAELQSQIIQSQTQAQAQVMSKPEPESKETEMSSPITINIETGNS